MLRPPSLPYFAVRLWLRVGRDIQRVIGEVGRRYPERLRPDISLSQNVQNVLVPLVMTTLVAVGHDRQVSGAGHQLDDRQVPAINLRRERESGEQFVRVLRPVAPEIRDGHHVEPPRLGELLAAPNSAVVVHGVCRAWVQHDEVDQPVEPRTRPCVAGQQVSMPFVLRQNRGRDSLQLAPQPLRGVGQQLADGQ